MDILPGFDGGHFALLKQHGIPSLFYISSMIMAMLRGMVYCSCAGKKEFGGAIISFIMSSLEFRRESLWAQRAWKGVRLGRVDWDGERNGVTT